MTPQEFEFSRGRDLPASARTRLRVLISAYACRPGQGSEPGVGWNWAFHLAQSHDVWVLAPGHEKESIENYQGELPSGLRFVFSDPPRFVKPLGGSTLEYMIYYHLWQLWAYRIALDLHKQYGFDVTHHLTVGAHWKPSLLSLLPVPFIWGPVGGGERAPKGFRRFLGWRSVTFEFCRTVVQTICQLNPLVRVTARKAVLGLAKSKETADRLRAMKCRQVLLLSEAGLSEAEMQRLGEMPTPSGPCRFLSLGRLLTWKGFEIGLRAFARIHEEVPDAVYSIVGDGAARKRLEAVAESLGIAKKVEFCGKLPRSQAMERLGQSTVLVHPSLHDSGGWVCLEAMAAGRPVICLDVGGPATQVTDDTGFRIEPRSPEQTIEEMAGVMGILANNRGLVERMGAAGRAHLARNYSLTGLAASMSQLYSQCAHSSRAAREVQIGA